MLVVHAAVIILGVRSQAPIGAPVQSSVEFQTAPGAAGTGAPPDISSLTPREAADRLYERIMRASEANDTAQVQFFAPMALNAYGRVQPMDADARLHLGLIEIAAGEPAAALVQADSITRSAGLHLFGPLLKARAADAAGNRAAARDAYRAFLANYDAELRKNLPEYADHTILLGETRDIARRAGSR